MTIIEERGIENFVALPHRLQFLVEAQGRKFYNDSLATTPESAAAALHSFTEPIVLLAGGYDKQVSLHELSQAAAAPGTLSIRASRCARATQ